MFPTRILRSSLREIPHHESISMAYDLHQPIPSLLKSAQSVKKNDPILFVPGIFGLKKSYAQDSKIIADSTQSSVYTLDLRNHGESKHAKPFNYNTLANDIKSFCDEHKLGSVRLVGYSLGAKISMLTALQFPDLVKSAVIIDNAPIQQPHIELYLNQYMKSMVHLLDEVKISKNDKDWKNKANESMKKFLPNGIVRKNLLVNLVNNKPLNHNDDHSVVDYSSKFINFMNPIHHMNDELNVVKEVCDWPLDATTDLKFEGPIKFIRGLKSPFITKEGLEKIHEHFPNVEFNEVNSNHDILDQRPHEYVRIICDFFNIQRYKDMSFADSRGSTQQEINV